MIKAWTDEANRLVYEVTGDTALFHSCRDHYR